MSSSRTSPALPTGAVNVLAPSRMIAYSALAIPLAMLNVSLGTYLPTFYASEVGLSMATIGTIMFMGRIWDAAADPFIGYLSDRTRSRFGRRKPWLVAGAPLMMLATLLCFMPPEGASATYLALVTLLIYSVWAIVQIPYLSWGMELSADYADRTRITGWREAASMAGVVLSVALPLLFFGAEPPSLRSVLTLYTIAMLLLIPLSCLAAASICPDPQPIRIAASRPEKHWRAFAKIMKNRPFVRFVAIYTAFRAAWSGFDALYILLFTLYLKVPGGFLSFIFLQYTVSIVFSPVTVRLANRFGKHRVLALSLVGGGLVALALVTVVRPGHVADAVIAFTLFGMTNAALWILPTAIIADVVDYGRLTEREDQGGSYMAVLNLAQKLGLAIGVGITFPLLGLFGFDATGIQDAVEIDTLRWVSGLMPLVILLPSALALWRFPIDRARQAIIRRRLAGLELRRAEDFSLPAGGLVPTLLATSQHTPTTTEVR